MRSLKFSSNFQVLTLDLRETTVTSRTSFLFRLMHFVSLARLDITHLFVESDTEFDKAQIGHALAMVVRECKRLTLFLR